MPSTLLHSVLHLRTPSVLDSWLTLERRRRQHFVSDSLLEEVTLDREPSLSPGFASNAYPLLPSVSLSSQPRRNAQLTETQRHILLSLPSTLVTVKLLHHIISVSFSFRTTRSPSVYTHHTNAPSAAPRLTTDWSTNMESLPLELKQRVCSYLTPKDLKSLRLTAKVFASAACRNFLPRVFLHNHPSSFEEIQDITDHPDLKHSVTTLVVDTSFLCSFPRYDHWARVFVPTPAYRAELERLEVPVDSSDARTVRRVRREKVW